MSESTILPNGYVTQTSIREVWTVYNLIFRILLIFLGIRCPSLEREFALCREIIEREAMMDLLCVECGEA